MAYCPDCDRTVDDRHDTCDRCGGTLDPRDLSATLPSELVEVYEGEPRWAAVVVRELKAAGIEPVMRDSSDSLPGASAYMMRETVTTVLVANHDAKEAERVLAQVRRDHPEAFPEGTV